MAFLRCLLGRDGSAHGVPFQTVEKTPGDDPAYWPFNEGHSFFIPLNLAVGGWFEKPHLPPEEMSPQRP